MTLKEQLMEDMKTAMRAREQVRLDTIRFMMSEIKNFEIDNGEQDDAGLQSLVAKQVKQMKDAMSEFERGNRMDLVEQEQVKVTILEGYLPKQLSNDEVLAIVQEVVASSDQKQMGPIMQQVRAKVGNQADGGTISMLVKQVLATA
jgi:uncharacterized protein